MKKHIHVYKVLERAEISVEADNLKEANNIALEMAENGELEFSEKGLDEEIPKRFIALSFSEQEENPKERSEC